jgi:exopolysaccharide biosynthesis protein
MNGKPASIKGNGGFGYAPRTAIAQRQDGIVLFLVFDGRDFGRNLGASMNDVTNLFLRYKAYNATNLDGGGSCTLVIEDELINKPSGGSYTGARYIPNSWMVK